MRSRTYSKSQPGCEISDESAGGATRLPTSGTRALRARRKRERGFTLAETAVAAFIAASILTASMAALATAARSIRAAEDSIVASLEALNIVARVKVGMALDDAADARTWRAERAPFGQEARLDRIVIAHRTHPSVRFEFLVQSENVARSDGAAAAPAAR